MVLMMSHFSPFPVETPRLRVQGIGVREAMRPVRFDRPRGWPHYLFVLFYDPTPCQTRQESAVVPRGTLVCWRPGTPHALGDPERPWSHSWLSVGGSDVAAVLRQTRFPLDKPVPLYDLTFFDAALAELYGEVSRPQTGPDAMDVEIARAAVTSIIRRLARGIRPVPQRARVPKELLDVRDEIYARHHEALRLADLAEVAGLSVSQLCLLHQRHFGETVMAHLREIRLRNAAVLLRDTELKVRAIAERVGYPDHFHFSKSFRRRFGMAPTGFRAAQRAAIN